jgi:hypothetical protein
MPSSRLARFALPAAALVLVTSACTGRSHHTAPTTSAGSPAPSSPGTPASSALAGSSGNATGSPAPSAPASPSPALTAATSAARLPQALSRVSAVVLGGKVVVVGGLTAAQQTTAHTELFDPSAGSVVPAAQLAVAVHDAAAADVAGTALLVGGGAAASSDAVQAISPAGTSTVIAHLPQPRSDDSVAVDGSTLYVVGGYDGVHELPGVLATTDAGHTFHQVGQLAQTVRYAAAAAVSGSLFVFGGEHGGTAISDIQQVDPATGTTTVVGHFPHRLAHAASVVLGGRVLVLGGSDGTNPQNTVYAFDPSTHAVSVVGSLPESVSDAAAVVVGDSAYVIGGNALTAEQTVAATTAIVQLTMRPVAPAASTAAYVKSSPAAAAPFTGKLLIADRGNNRLLLVDAAGRISWTFPNEHAAAPASGFYFPDDAFFTDGGKAIISNQEGNNTIVKIAYPQGNSLWSYGHPGTAGTGPGFLHEPDDAYQLKDGRVIVADANNCRIVIISPQAQQVGQIGTTGSCVHKPPTSLGYPNGDTPLQNGNVLISEVTGSWISEYTLTGSLVWTLHVPITYPSDPQQIGPDKYIVADYARPGGIVEFDREGHILWDYHVPSGHGMLDHPSLAEVLPSGLICANDDYRHRVVIIDPSTKTIVWQYGLDDVSGTAPGLLNTPDGFDLLAPDGTTPTHPWTG